MCFLHEIQKNFGVGCLRQIDYIVFDLLAELLLGSFGKQGWNEHYFAIRFLIGLKHELQGEPEGYDVSYMLSESLEAKIPILESQVIFTLGCLNWLLVDILGGGVGFVRHSDHIELLAERWAFYQSLQRFFSVL